MYALFAGDFYYPCGGWNDYVGTYGSYAEAQAVAIKGDTAGEYDWWHVVNLDTSEITQEKP